MSSSLNFNCPRCGRPLANESAGLPDGASIVCPHCGITVTQGSGAAQLPLSQSDINRQQRPASQ